MNYINAFRKLDETRIRSDRELLAELGLSDAAAAKYLGKSRQALNLKLGPKRADDVREPYFKLSDILVLVIAAQDRRHPFDVEAVRRFVNETAAKRAGGSAEAYKLLEQRLAGVEEVDLGDVGTVVMVLPAFADIPALLPDFSRDLRRLAETLATLRPAPSIAILSSSRMQANMAAEWLALPKARCFTHENVDQYVPSVLVFPRKGGDPRPYALNDRGGLGAATQFRTRAMGEYVKFMLPAEAREELFTYEEPAEGDDGEVMHRTQAKSV